MRCKQFICEGGEKKYSESRRHLALGTTSTGATPQSSLKWDQKKRRANEGRGDLMGLTPDILVDDLSKEERLGATVTESLH